MPELPATEIRMDTIDLTARPQPTAARPLLGTTLLLVEDSRFASEAVRLLAQRSGARLRRADSLTAARRHLGIYRPDVLIVDIGLPDGSGLDLVAEFAHRRDRPRVVLAPSALPEGEAEAAARRAGAGGFLPKPLASLAAFQAAILRHLPPGEQPLGPRPVPADRVEPDRLALSEDLAFATRALDEGRLPPSYVAQFVRSLARADGDQRLADGVARLLDRAEGRLAPELRSLLSERGDVVRSVF
jgi:CheY-like chemotaxis protein